MKLTQSILVSLCLLSRIQQAISFTTSPISKTLPENTTASFSCVPSYEYAEDVSWSVYFQDLQKYFVSLDHSHQLEFERRGILFSNDDSASYMNISAVEVNNGTTVRCREFSVGIGTIFSEVATLTVAGPPLPPEVRMSLSSATEIVLEWEEPYTSQAYPILNYTVVETEIATGHSRTFTSHTLNYTHTISTVATQCREIKFAIAATNGIGDSTSITVTAGLPVAPVNDFKAEVLSSGTDNIETIVLVKPPPVCIFQQAKLLLSILHQNSNLSMQVGVKNYTGIANTFEFHLQERLIPDDYYTLVTTVSTIAGNVTTHYQFTTPSIGSVTTSSMKVKSPLGNDRSMVVILICSIVGGMGGVLLIAVVLISLVLVARKRRSSDLLQESDKTEQILSSNSI